MVSEYNQSPHRLFGFHQGDQLFRCRAKSGMTEVSWALLVYMQNCQPTLLVLIDHRVKLVDLFKTMELLNNRYAFYSQFRTPLPVWLLAPDAPTTYRRCSGSYTGYRYASASTSRWPHSYTSRCLAFLHRIWPTTAILSLMLVSGDCVPQRAEHAS